MQNHQDIKDFLTGVYTREAMRYRLAEESARAARYKDKFSILVIDIDHFKTINDSYGHVRGDQILKELAARMMADLRDSDLVYRFGGDEFVIILPESSLEQARHFADRFSQNIRQTVFEGTPPIHISVSTGIASHPADTDDPLQLFDIADQRMLDAKRQGRGLIVDSTSETAMDLPFDVMSRPLDRDLDILSANQFLESVKERSRGVMIISGREGAGRSRFLREIQSVAKIHAMEIISIGSPRTPSKRQFRALVSARHDIRMSFRGCKTPEAYSAAMERNLLDQKIRYLAILVDDIHMLDPGSRKVLELLLKSPLEICIALCFTLPKGVQFNITDFSAPVQEFIELNPLTQDSVKIWIRILLHWEAPDDFILKLFRETSGLPGYIRKALTFLLKRGIIRKLNGRWLIQDKLHSINLADRLGFQVQPSLVNLPSILTQFIGREEETRKIVQRMQTKRMITIAGPGGTGKTRLAIKVGEDQCNRFQHGCHFIALASVHKPEFIVPAIAESIRFHFYGTALPKTQLLNYLREKNLLLIFDNFEHLVPGGAILAEILEACPRISIIATSRHRLRIRGETVIELRGMPYPSDDSQFDESGYSAIQLFIQSARSVDNSYMPSPDDKLHIIRICKLVDGFPLGIELAAAWIRVLSCAMIADEIERNLDFLEAYTTDMPERQKSLRAVFEHSWNLLSEPERLSFARMSHFRGGFNSEAVRLAADVQPATLNSLMDKSLLYHVGSDRYYILEVLRQYGESKLTELPVELERVRIMHSAYYASLLESHLRVTESDVGAPEVARLFMEIENIRHGWRSAIFLKDTSLIDRYLEGLSSYYDRTGMYPEAEAMMAMAIETLNGDADHDGISREFRQVIGKLYRLQGSFQFALSRYDESKHSFDRAIQIFKSLFNLKEIAACMNGLGGIAMRGGDLGMARDFYENSLKLRRQENDVKGIASSLNNLANVMSSMGDNTGALKYYEESLKIVRDLGDKKATATLMANVGIMSGVMGDVQREEQYLKESYQIRQEIDDRAGIATSLDNLASVEFFKGNNQKAREMLSESLEIRREIGDRWAVANALMNLAKHMKSEEDYPTQVRCLTESLDIFRDIGDRCGLALAMSQLGGVLCSKDDCNRGMPLLSDAEKFFEEIGDRSGLILNKIRVAAAELKRGNRKEAKNIQRQAVADAMEIRSVQLANQVIIEHGKLLASGSNKEKELAVTLFAFLCRTQPLSKSARDSIQKQLKTLEKELTSPVYFFAEEYGKNATMDQVIQAIRKKPVQ